jgi:hypothetical protein
MKQFFILLSFTVFGVQCCKNSDLVNTGDARLTGIDYRKCASPYCGGWFVEIDNDTLRFFETPAETDIDFNDELQFPIPVEIEWERYDNEWKDVPGLIRVERIFRK